MVVLKIERDQARIIQEWFSYWKMICGAHISHPTAVENEKFMWEILLSIIEQLDQTFTERLSGFAQVFRFNFTKSEAITLHEFLKKQPIPSDQFYHNNFRQAIVNVLHKQL